MEKNKGVGVKRKRPIDIIKGSKNMIKKKKRSMTMRGIINYLKSDSYFYSPLISRLPSDSSALQQFVSPSPGLEVGEPILQNEGKLKEKFVTYLKSNTYLYAPLVGTKHPQHFTTKTVISTPKGQELLFKTVHNTILTSKIDWQTKQVAEDSAQGRREDYSSKGLGITGDSRVRSPQTPALQEVNNRVVRRSYRLLTSSGSR